VSTEKV